MITFTTQKSMRIASRILSKSILIVFVIVLTVLCITCERRESALPDFRTPRPNDPANTANIDWRKTPNIELALFSSGSTIWAITGRDRRLVVSVNSGEDWSEKTEITNARLLDFLDDRNGWLIAGDSQLYKTSDSGMSWQKMSKRSAFSLPRKLVITSPYSGWVWDANKLLHSTDGGANWHAIRKPPGKKEVASGDVFFASVDRGWLCDVGNDGPFVSKTVDSGTTWSKVLGESGTTQLPCEIFFADNSSGWVRFGRVGAQQFLSTGDAGKTWNSVESIPEGFQIRSMFWLSSSDGYLAGEFHERAPEFANKGRAGLLHTTDGGRTWTEVNVISGELFFDQIRFLNPSVGILTSLDSIFLSTNGGSTWSRVLKIGS